MILTAALMIAGATLTLLLSGVSFLSAFGPSMAVAVIVSALVGDDAGPGGAGDLRQGAAVAARRRRAILR